MSRAVGALASFTYTRTRGVTHPPDVIDVATRRPPQPRRITLHLPEEAPRERVDEPVRSRHPAQAA